MTQVNLVIAIFIEVKLVSFVKWVIIVNLVNLVNPAILMNLLILVELAKMMNLIIFNNLVQGNPDDSDPPPSFEEQRQDLRNILASRLTNDLFKQKFSYSKSDVNNERP